MNLGDVLGEREGRGRQRRRDLSIDVLAIKKMSGLSFIIVFCLDLTSVR